SGLLMGKPFLEAQAKRFNLLKVAEDDERHDVTFSQVQVTLGNQRELAKHWLRWAEAAGVLVRGTSAECRACGLKSWRAIAEFGQPLFCRGCGTAIKDPFQVDRVDFRYRASELLLRVIETDSLPHLLAIRWVMGLFSTMGESETLGYYPGV